MRIPARSLCLVALLGPAVLRGQRVPADGPALWSSFETCVHPTAMVIELRADKRVIHRKTVQFCHSQEARNSQRPFALVMTSAFPGGRTFQDEYRTTRAETIRADVWEASTDSDAVVLGVSFATKRKILLNTLHLLVPGKARADTIDAGLTVTSYPASSRRRAGNR